MNEELCKETYTMPNFLSGFCYNVGCRANLRTPDLRLEVEYIRPLQFQTYKNLKLMDRF